MALKIDNPRESIIDPYHSKTRYESNRKGVNGVSKKNNEIILKHLKDLEIGRNVNSIKGGRSYVRLNTIHSRLKKVAEIAEELFGKSIIDLSEEEVFEMFNGMSNGKIKKQNGSTYKSALDYVKVYKAFWHWYMKVNKKEGKRIIDITEDLDVKRDKPKFNYFTFEQMKSMAEHAKFFYKVLMWFLFDTGIRAPTELLNVKVKDLVYDEKEGIYLLDIREETSKTFGRKIKIMNCSSLIRRFIDESKLKSDDFLFSGKNPFTINKYLKRIGEKILGIKDLTMYDFRHSSACYWLSKYQSESALKWRFGWKKSDMIHYYTEYLGMKDTITEKDLIDEDTKNKLEAEIEKNKQKRMVMEEEIKDMRKQMKEVYQMLKNNMKEGTTTRITFPQKKEEFRKLIQIRKRISSEEN